MLLMHFQKEQMKQKDERSKMMTEILKGIKVYILKVIQTILHAIFGLIRIARCNQVIFDITRL